MEGDNSFNTCRVIYVKLFIVDVNSLLRYPEVSVAAFQVQYGFTRQCRI